MGLIGFPLTAICLGVTDAFKSGWNAHRAALHNRNRPHSQQCVFPSAPSPVPKGRDTAPSKAPHSRREAELHTAQELQVSYFIPLALPGLETEPGSLNQGMKKDRHSNFIEIQQWDKHTEDGKKLPKMKNSATKTLTYTGKFPFWPKTSEALEQPSRSWKGNNILSGFMIEFVLIMIVCVTRLAAIMSGGDTDRILHGKGGFLYIPPANINCLLACSMHKFWKDCWGRAWGEGRGRGRRRHKYFWDNSSV